MTPSPLLLSQAFLVARIKQAIPASRRGGQSGLFATLSIRNRRIAPGSLGAETEAQIPKLASGIADDEVTETRAGCAVMRFVE